jgi:hypothetical protein
MPGKGGLFAVMGPPSDEEEDDDLEDFSSDLEEEAPEELDISAGPFDAYAETVFDENADPAARSDALRQAILVALEERGR